MTTELKAPEKKRTRGILNFRGGSDAIDLGRKPEFRLRRELTLEAWVYAIGRGSCAGIISKIWDTNDTESGYGLLLDSGSGFFLGIKPRRAGGGAQEVRLLQREAGGAGPADRGAPEAAHGAEQAAASQEAR